MQRGNDCAVRERELPFTKGLYRNVIAQLGAHLFQFASCSRQVVDGDQAQVTVSVRNCDCRKDVGGPRSPIETGENRLLDLESVKKVLEIDGERRRLAVAEGLT